MYRSVSPASVDEPPVPAALRKIKPLPKRRRVAGFPMDPSNYAAAQAFLALAAEHGHDLGLAPDAHPMALWADLENVLKPQPKPEQAQLDYTTNSHSRDDEESVDGDYVDHLQQPGNTKKRKVPQPPVSSYQTERLDVDPDWGNREGVEPSEYPSQEDGRAHEQATDSHPIITPAPRKQVPKHSRATRACIRNKELIKMRKRQLTAVLGVVHSGNPLALDQALASAQPFLKSDPYGLLKDAYRIRLSTRSTRKAERRATKLRDSLKSVSSLSQEANLDFPSLEFDFNRPSPTATRLIATRKEVASLHAKFETELTKQAARVAEAAKRSAARAAKRAGAARGDAQTPSMDPNALPKSSGGRKKKKRSAMANASNPHHLRNYVPSRVLNSGNAPPSAQVAAANAQNLVGPLPLRFLSAQLPPRRNKGERVASGTGNIGMTAPGDEWICAFCEFDLFYSMDENAFRRAVRNRKRVLSRRRRAREKAAVSAGGGKTGATSPSGSNGSGPETGSVGASGSGIAGDHDETGERGVATRGAAKQEDG